MFQVHLYGCKCLEQSRGCLIRACTVITTMLWLLILIKNESLKCHILERFVQNCCSSISTGNNFWHYFSRSYFPNSRKLESASSSKDYHCHYNETFCKSLGRHAFILSAWRHNYTCVTRRGGPRKLGMEKGEEFIHMRGDPHPSLLASGSLGNNNNKSLCLHSLSLKQWF